MTSMAFPGRPAEAPAVRRVATRNDALDRARTLITVLVVLYHSASNYRISDMVIRTGGSVLISLCFSTTASSCRLCF